MEITNTHVKTIATVEHLHIHQTRCRSELQREMHDTSLNQEVGRWAYAAVQMMSCHTKVTSIFEFYVGVFFPRPTITDFM